MNFNSFFDHVEESNSILEVSECREEKGDALDNEALFQLPLISLVILLLAKDKRKPKMPELGRMVGEVLEQSMPAFRHSKQHISWSANLRIRTIKAMIFLESSGFVIVNNSKGKVEATESGKKLINKAISQESNLSFNLIEIAKSYRNICVSRKLDLEL
ncbi:TPA: hypothetical protein I7264_03450 [Vibrio parahaemolyticus]|uniref:hypothetical protein n=1 Tax=Vibrio parahaemolyticus TaxID=670 RepID=UPI000C9ABB41|nr:hypothetical protein [Vibrio parahaemolyticus]HAS6130355.1 hypothetical protein [Vibrio vulnificus]MBE4468272.1 hypothetical protein [Vibrio parahaemolyticus]MDF4259085.1 hypothetical protein [Vibrio parahaemolyticus]MDF4264212.1 hypothetical protein [Vibrio parahaemolyticus]MDF4326163.1 hypothetical protein [Vibrio parahaemolyticus]